MTANSFARGETDAHDHLLDSAAVRGDNDVVDSGGFDPGWYPSPGERGVLRRWDGERWTDERSVRIGSKVPGGPRWWVTATIILAAVAVPIVVIAFLVAGFFAMGHPGGTTPRPPPAADVSAEACQLLTSVLNQKGGTRVDQIMAGNSGISDLISVMRATGPNFLARETPAEEWLADWEAISAERESFAADLENGDQPLFREPRAPDGTPVSVRMIDASPTECRRAVMLAIRP